MNSGSNKRYWRGQVFLVNAVITNVSCDQSQNILSATKEH